MNWYEEWFNDDYLRLYPHRDEREAEEQVEALVQILALTPGQRLLDLGCGAGRHAIPFAKRGINVVGLDSSSCLIQKAQKKSGDLSVQFILGDMRDLKALGTFDVVVSLFTSFGYFNDQDNSRVMENVGQCLKNQGSFLLDYLHPYQVKKQLIPEEVKMIDDKKIFISRKIENQRVIKKVTFPKRAYEESVRLYSREELRKMADKSGLKELAAWDDFYQNPWSQQGNRQILLYGL